jgi:hypothetical protein
LILRGSRTKVLLHRLDASWSCPDPDTSSNKIQDAWPQRLNLQGFVYDQLGVDPDPGPNMRKHLTCWYEKWLGRDLHFSPQPYLQLASVLRTMGDPGRAEDVLYAARDRELTEAWDRGDYWEVTWLELQKWLIGYGIGSKLFRIFIWVAVFTLIGMVILVPSPWFWETWAQKKTSKARAKHLVWMFGASLDHLLPIVSLNKEFEDFFHDPLPRKRLKGWQLGYFSFHALFGFLLGTLVGAALAGLTQPG